MRIFVATSKGFYSTAQAFCREIEERGHATYHPFFDRDQSAIEADPAIKIAVTREHFPEVAASDILYALTPNGYVGTGIGRGATE